MRCPHGLSSGLPSLLSWGSLWGEEGQAPGALLGKCPHGVLIVGSSMTGAEAGPRPDLWPQDSCSGTHVSVTTG